MNKRLIAMFLLISLFFISSCENDTMLSETKTLLQIEEEKALEAELEDSSEN